MNSVIFLAGFATGFMTSVVMIVVTWALDQKRLDRRLSADNRLRALDNTLAAHPYIDPDTIVADDDLPLTANDVRGGHFEAEWLKTDPTQGDIQ